MDLSGVIFVAVAVAWAAYLIPQALKHHDEAVERRTVERFSAGMRVLVRRGASESTADAPATAGPGSSARADLGEPAAAPTPAQLRARRAAARRAMQRRRRVLGVLLGLLVLGVVLTGINVIAPIALVAPVGLLAAWLVACRVMVKGERESFATARAQVAPEPVAAPVVPTAASREEDLAIPADDYADAEAADLLDANAETTLMTAVSPEFAAPVDDRDPATLWDPVAVPLPTYVGKDHAAARELPAFDFDDSGVWSSGRDESDSELVRRTAATAADDSDAGAEAGERHVV